MLVIDLEATCWKGSRLPTGERQSIENMEIIELGCVQCDRAGTLLDARSFLVKPTINPELSDFCRDLTGITQAMVDQAPSFPTAVEAMNDWLGDPGCSFFWGSWGNYDLKHLVAESQRLGVRSLPLQYPHVNLRKLWRLTTKQRKKNSLRDALNFHDLVFEGEPHQGLDDAKNIARLLPFMNWDRVSEARSLALF